MVSICTEHLSPLLTKIGNFERRTINAEQQVLGLEIAMTNMVVVTVLESTNQLLEEVQCLAQREATMLEQIVEQFSALNVLENQEPDTSKLGK